MTEGERCGFCWEGETGFPPDAETCSTCHGSGFVKPDARFDETPEPRFESRAEQRIDALDRAELDR